MNKQYILESYNLIKDAMNPNNAFIVRCAIDELFHLIKQDKMNSLEDYIAFKEEWYPQMKNKQKGSNILHIPKHEDKRLNIL